MISIFVYHGRLFTQPLKNTMVHVQHCCFCKSTQCAHALLFYKLYAIANNVQWHHWSSRATITGSDQHWHVPLLPQSLTHWHYIIAHMLHKSNTHT